MRLLIDATAVPVDRRGVGRYVDELIRALDCEFVVACQASDEAHYSALAPSATIVPIHGIRRSWRRLLWEQFGLPRVARRVGATVIHSPHYTLPVLSRLPRVTTFHDATFFSDPDVHTGVKGIFFRAWIRLSNRLASRVIVPSAATASELERYVRPRRPFAVVHHGVDHHAFRPPMAEAIVAVREQLGLPERWIAFLGTLEPRKNLPALIAAYGDVGTEIPLAIAGGAGWHTDLAPAIAAVPAPGRVIQLGYIDLEHVPAFLGGAEVTAYPSLGEGFGLPVLEAMACGGVVLTTPRLAIPEVGGDAVFYSEPDRNSLAIAIRALLDDPELRATLRSQGVDRAAHFTWEATAAGHRAVYEAASAG